MRTARTAIQAMLGVLVIAACSSTADAPLVAPASIDANARVSEQDGNVARTAVFRWNALSQSLSPSLSPNGSPTPWVEARLSAITNVAMHDALNGVRARYDRYADHTGVHRSANPAAAVIAAAYTAVVGATPAPAHDAARAAYDADIAALHTSASDDRIGAGIAVGIRAANAVLARRVGDGVDQSEGPYTPGSNPGDYRFTAPFDTPAFDFFGTGGFAIATKFGTDVRPFVIRSGRQFRVPRPYGAPDNASAVKTERYTRDYNEVLQVGCATCTARTADQSTLALFWVEGSPSAWNRIAISQATAANLDAWQTARLLALVQLAEFDAYVAVIESKYAYNFWRPVTAVALAGTDGNPRTEAHPGWEVVSFPTPPFPDYPSGHACTGAAAAAVIRLLLGRDSGPFTAHSASLPGVTRSFRSVEAAAKENADSRVYVGFHFRHATEIGLLQGAAVGSYVVSHELRRR